MPQKLYYCSVQQPSILLTTLNAKYIHINLAIRLLYELNKHDDRLAWNEFTIKEDVTNIANYCSKYEVVCFSCYIWNITQTLKVCKLIKQINPSTKILLGGPEVTYDWQQIIKLNCIDYIITGEGEIPFAAFLQAYPNINNIANLVSKNQNEIIYHSNAENVDLFIYENTNPYKHDDVKTLPHRVLYIETSRGCPYKCEFCLASLDNKVRYLPMQHIKNNLLYLMQHGKTIKFLDRTFNVKKDFTLDIFQFILQHARPENVFQFEITADILHPSIMEFIQTNVPKGMFRFEIGIQTVNQKANLEVSRKQNFEKTKNVILQLCNKVEMHLDLIVGLPLDYWQDIKYSFEEVFKLFAPELQLGFLKFLKGTPVRDKHQQHGYVFDEVAPYQIIQSNYLSQQELYKITLLENVLEVYWNKKRLINTLKYITTNHSIFDFFIQLGDYFKTQTADRLYSGDFLYQLVYNFMCITYPNNKVLKQLVTIDYYLQYSIKPSLQLYPEIDKKQKFEVLQQLNFNHNKNRYAIMPLDFDFNYYNQHLQIIPQKQMLIIEYTGTKKPTYYIKTQNTYAIEA